MSGALPSSSSRLTSWNRDSSSKVVGMNGHSELSVPLFQLHQYQRGFFPPDKIALSLNMFIFGSEW